MCVCVNVHACMRVMLGIILHLVHGGKVSQSNPALISMFVLIQQFAQGSSFLCLLRLEWQAGHSAYLVSVGI